MSIKPIDFQVTIPRTTDASKIHSEEASRNAAAQQQSAATVQHKVDADLRQVMHKDTAQKIDIKEKKEEKDKNGKEKKEKKEKQSGRKK